jgi:predicted nuclease of predicted toxin-antitoxin system
MLLLADRNFPGYELWGLAAATGADLVYELGLGGQPDEQIMALADRENRILISADTDFGELLANASVLAPSVILLRRAGQASRISHRSRPREPRTGRRRPDRRR